MTAPLRLILLLATALAVLPAKADGLKAFGAAVQRAAAQCQVVLRTLETSGRDQTAAEVRLFRETWQEIVDRFEADRRDGLDDDNFYSIIFTEIDARLVAVLIVIDIGSRDAAREALKPIGDTLARLRERTGPR